MKFKGNISFTILVMLAVIIGFSVFSYLQTTQINVLIFTDNFVSGTEITKDMFTEVPLSAEMVFLAEDANQKEVYVVSERLSDYLGQRLRTDVLRGTFFTANMAGTYGASPTEARLRENMVALTVPANNLTAVSPLIQPGARVNVHASFTLTDASGLETQNSILLLQNVRVLDVLYEDFAEEENAVKPISGVTLEIVAGQSSRLSYAVQFGSIQLALTKPGAYQETANILFTNTDLLKEISR